MTEVLYAAAFIVGEYSASVDDYLPALESLLQPRAAALSATVQSIYMQNVLKLVTKLAAAATNSGETEEAQTKANHDLDIALQLVEGRLPLFTRSVHLEVQERACFLDVLLKLLKEQREAKSAHLSEFFGLTTEQLNPVSSKAQRKVQVPQGLDLDAWIIEPPAEEPPMTFEDTRGERSEWSEWEEEGKAEYNKPMDPEERRRQREARRRNMAANPHYLGEDLGLGDDEDDEASAPVQRLSGADLGLEEGALNTKYRKPTRPGAAKTKKVYTIMTTEDMPEGVGGDSDDEKNNKHDSSRKDALSGVDLSNIGTNETLPVVRP
jgi:AP-3 complex subunit delta-1